MQNNHFPQQPHSFGTNGSTTSVPVASSILQPSKDDIALMNRQKVTPELMRYTERFEFPYITDITNYEKLAKIGQGTFGEVFKARCKRTGRIVALKKILMENEKEGFPITALREVKMLQKLKHKHITELIEICSSRASVHNRERSTFYLVFSFCEHDLAGLLSNTNVRLSLVHIKTLMKHLLEGLYQIHFAKILHRDMKAANVLITKDGILKLADFGLARPLFSKLPGQPEHCYTNRVVTLWYRPPELLLGERHYGPQIDMWGAGCIMAELWTRTPILQGESEQKQLALISNLCGSINPQTWRGVENLPLYGKMELQQNLNRRVVERLEVYVRDRNALNLIDSLLVLDPSLRLDAEQALDHLFFFTQPHPAADVKDLMSTISTSLFEYTAGRGAHSGRGRGVHHQNRQNIRPSMTVQGQYVDMEIHLWGFPKHVMIFMTPYQLDSTLEINDKLLEYRRMAGFCWHDLQEWLYGSESIKFKNEVFEKLRASNVFVRDWRTLTMDESRQICDRRWKQFLEYNFITFDGLKTNPERFVDFAEILESYDQSLAAKFYISAIFYVTILSMGTNRHHQILEKCRNNEIVGCFCLTELSHGSDANSVRTECHYDEGQFLMHTPDNEAIKCWAGNLGSSLLL
ncbi:Cyclin-dependent kinase 9 domain protein [Acanthocheilonema viteae]